MSSPEKHSEEQNRNENEPGIVTELQNAILTKADQWKMEGTPWFTPGLMRDTLEAEGNRDYRSTITALGTLDARGFMDCIKGEKVKENGPFSEVPGAPLSAQDSDHTIYSRITEGGRRARRIIESPERSTSRSASWVPKPSN